MIGWRTCGEGWTGSTGGATWITDYWPQVVPACEARRPPSAMEEEVAGYDQLRIWMVYVRAAYWGVATMSSLGYAARLTAHTETEMVFAIFVQVLGACLNAAIFSNVATVINRGDAAYFEVGVGKVINADRARGGAPAVPTRADHSSSRNDTCFKFITFIMAQTCLVVVLRKGSVSDCDLGPLMSRHGACLRSVGRSRTCNLGDG